MTHESSSSVKDSTPGFPVWAEVRAMLGAAGVSALDSMGWVSVTGEDRVRWLNGMVTNSIQAMGSGEGSYSFLLSAQGRIQGDVTAFAEPERILLEMELGEMERVTELLERFIIMDDVELGRVDGMGSGVLVAGPEAEAVLGRVGMGSLPVASPGLVRTVWRGAEVVVVRGVGVLAPRFEVWGDAATVAGLRAEMEAAGAAGCGPEAAEAVRVMEGVPRFGVDIRDRDLPQETGQRRALHFSKGCYLGQEIVERIRSRGAVHRGFGGFVLEGAAPAEGAMGLTTEDGKAVGELTSVLKLPDGGWMALGYVRRDAVERGGAMRYEGGVARLVELPFRLAGPPGARDASEL